MNPNDDQTTRWLAYLLGDLEPGDAARVEAEMRDDPSKAEEVRKFFEATTDWAKRPVADAPINMDELAARTRDAANVRVGRARFRAAWPWAAVAAAVLLVVALSQASFSMQLGGATLAWGNPPQTQAVTQLEGKISALNESYAELATDNLRLYNGFEEFMISLQQLETQLQVATAELARNQQREAYTRYADMQRLLEITRRASAALLYGNDPAAVQAS
ncbi:MAG: hypothetical protein IID09_08410, partial [Candidatus Hydrogenedentes bacterium]|nr:hypothetical protein [Candidatus Hydrogenedentota bacterium]